MFRAVIKKLPSRLPFRNAKALIRFDCLCIFFLELVLLEEKIFYIIVTLSFKTFKLNIYFTNPLTGALDGRSRLKDKFWSS